MSATSLDCLTALGLDELATERDVRRAYARLLKTIDHETEVDAFHALREDYQAALSWVAARERQVVPQDPPRRGDMHSVEPAGAHDPRDPGKADADAASAPVPVPAAAVASGDPVAAVFDAFNARLATEIDSEASAQAALMAALQDPGLSSLDAPARFEARVAVLLAEGWQPGHQFLFAPAIRVFAWKEDFRRFESLGQIGQFLHAAMLQRDYFFTLQRDVFDLYADLIRRLRDDTDPSVRLLVEDLAKLRILVEQFPEWLQVVTSMRNVQRWFDLAEALPASKRRQIETRLGSLQALQPGGTETPARRGGFSWGGWVIWLLVLGLPSLKSCIDAF